MKMDHGKEGCGLVDTFLCRRCGCYCDAFVPAEKSR